MGGGRGEGTNCWGRLPLYQQILVVEGLKAAYSHSMQGTVGLSLMAEILEVDPYNLLVRKLYISSKCRYLQNTSCLHKIYMMFYLLLMGIYILVIHDVIICNVTLIYGELNFKNLCTCCPALQSLPIKYILIVFHREQYATKCLINSPF